MACPESVLNRDLDTMKNIILKLFTIVPLILFCTSCISRTASKNVVVDGEGLRSQPKNIAPISTHIGPWELVETEVIASGIDLASCEALMLDAGHEIKPPLDLLGATGVRWVLAFKIINGNLIATTSGCLNLERFPVRGRPLGLQDVRKLHIAMNSKSGRPISLTWGGGKQGPPTPQFGFVLVGKDQKFLGSFSIDLETGDVWSDINLKYLSPECGQIRDLLLDLGIPWP